MEFNRKYLSLAFISIVIATIYLWGVPAWYEYSHQREMQRLNQIDEQAKKQLEISMKEQQAKLGALCNADNVNYKTNTSTRTDGGTKPNTHATATITADKDMFIYGPSIKLASTGSRHESGLPRLLKSPYNENIKNSEFKNSILQEASLTVWCSHSNIFGTSSCTATATISAKLLSTSCIKYIAEKELDKIT